jgi:tetratricopeptide (TPR) repeat protein
MALCRLGFALRQHQPDTALALCHQALQLATQIGFLQGEALAAKNLGAVHFQKADYAEAIRWGQHALALGTQLPDSATMAAALHNLGNAHLRQGNRYLGLQHYLRALEIRRALADSAQVAALLVNLGTYYTAEENYARAAEYCTQAAAYFRNQGNAPKLAAALLSLGIAQLNQDNLPQAEASLAEALAIAQRLADSPTADRARLNLGNLALLQGNPTLALKLLAQSRAGVAALADSATLARILALEGRALLATGQAAAARAKGEEALRAARAVESLVLEHDARGLLHTACAALGQYAQAVEHLQRFNALADSLGNNADARQQAQLEAQHEYEMARLAEALAAQLAALKLAEARTRRNLLIYSGVALFLVAAAAGAVAGKRLKRSRRFSEALSFVAAMVAFEFLLVLLDPPLDDLAQGNPLLKLSANLGIALVVVPLHSLVARRLGL